MTLPSDAQERRPPHPARLRGLRWVGTGLFNCLDVRPAKLAGYAYSSDATYLLYSAKRARRRGHFVSSFLMRKTSNKLQSS